LTAAQARALGIPAADASPARPRAARRALPRGRAVSTCHTCGEQFTTYAAETRHVAATLHARYRLDITRGMADQVTRVAYHPGMSDDPTVPDPLDPDAPDAPDEDPDPTPTP
jgi:hypothetical protein